MLVQSCTYLHARPDFGIFRFVKGVAGSLILELSFTSKQPGIFDLCVERCQLFHNAIPPLLLDDDVEDLLTTVIQVIELYTGKYPDRTVRLRQNSRLQATLFPIILDVYRERLDPMFLINEQKAVLPFLPRRPNGATIILKRKPDSLLKAHPIQFTLNTHSRLFGNAVHVRLCEGMQRS